MDIPLLDQVSVAPQRSLTDETPLLSAFILSKRSIDIIGAALLIAFFLPLMIILALIIRADRHPAFYGQTRLGRSGREFRIWKFRSMVADADLCLERHLADPKIRGEWERTQKLQHDPRITPIGRFIRKYSLDELPQLWNVLCGDMSLVGPRPMLPEQRVLYPGDACFKVRPGITGLWQVSERNASSFADRARYDEAYVSNLTMRLEFEIIFKTVGVVLRGTGY